MKALFLIIFRLLLLTPRSTAAANILKAAWWLRAVFCIARGLKWGWVFERLVIRLEWNPKWRTAQKTELLMRTVSPHYRGWSCLSLRFTECLRSRRSKSLHTDLLLIVRAIYKLGQVITACSHQATEPFKYFKCTKMHVMETVGSILRVPIHEMLRATRVARPMR